MNKIIETAEKRFKRFMIANPENRKLSGYLYIAVFSVKPTLELAVRLLGRVEVVNEREIVEMISKTEYMVTNFILGREENTLPTDFFDSIGIKSQNYYTVVMGQNIKLNHKFLMDVLFEANELTPEMIVNLLTDFEDHVTNVIL